MRIVNTCNHAGTSAKWDLSSGANEDTYRTKVNGVGGYIGIGKGWFGYISYTFLFDPPHLIFGYLQEEFVKKFID